MRIECSRIHSLIETINSIVNVSLRTPYLEFLIQRVAVHCHNRSHTKYVYLHKSFYGNDI